MLGNNDFQSMHPHTAWHAAQGIATLVDAIRQAPIEPGMPVPPVLIVAPPPIGRRGARWRANSPMRPPSRRGSPPPCGRPSAELGCHFFDAGGVTGASRIDGIHLDADQHLVLGKALAAFVVDAALARP